DAVMVHEQLANDGTSRTKATFDRRIASLNKALALSLVRRVNDLKFARHLCLLRDNRMVPAYTGTYRQIHGSSSPGLLEYHSPEPGRKDISTVRPVRPIPPSARGAPSGTR